MADNAVLARNVDGAPVCDICSQTVAFSHYNHFSAQLPVDASGQLVAGGIKEQAQQCFTNLKTIIEGIDRKLEDTVRVSIFLKDINDLDAVNEVYKTFYKDYLPTRTVVAVDALPLDGALLQVDAVLSHGLGTIPDAPQADDLIILARNTDKAPKCENATQTCAFSHYNNITTQLPVDPATGNIVSGGVKEQLNQCLRNVKNIVESIDVPIDDLVKVTIFTKDVSKLDEINEIYKTYFPDSAIARTVAYYPARSVVEVKDLPKGADVAVECVCSHGDGTPPQAVEDRHGLIVEPNNTDKVHRCPMTTQTVAFSHYNNISGQLPVDASGNMVSGGAGEQTEQCLANIKAIVESVDHKMEDVVKVNIYLADMSALAEVDAAYKKFFPDGTPARRVVGVAKNVKDATVLIDAVVSNAEGTPPIL